MFSQQTLKFCKSLVGKKLFKIYPSVYNNFRHLCFFTRWLTTDFQRVQQRKSSLHLYWRSSQVRDHSDEGHVRLPSSCQVRKIQHFESHILYLIFWFSQELKESLCDCPSLRPAQSAIKSLNLHLYHFQASLRSLQGLSKVF